MGIDLMWDFSTIYNNDLFSEGNTFQLITCPRWKWTIFWQKYKVLPSNRPPCCPHQHSSINSQPEGISVDDPASLSKTDFSSVPRALWLPPDLADNRLILCTSTADLIVSLWRENPQLHSVKWQTVHQLWAGHTVPSVAVVYRWAGTLTLR